MEVSTKAIGLMAGSMGTEPSKASRVCGTRETGSTTSSMERVRRSGPIGRSTSANSSEAKRLAKACSAGLMGPRIRVKSSTTNSTATARILGQ